MGDWDWSLLDSRTLPSLQYRKFGGTYFNNVYMRQCFWFWASCPNIFGLTLSFTCSITYPNSMQAGRPVPVLSLEDLGNSTVAETREFEKVFADLYTWLSWSIRPSIGERPLEITINWLILRDMWCELRLETVIDGLKHRRRLRINESFGIEYLEEGRSCSHAFDSEKEKWQRENEVTTDIGPDC